MLEYEKKLLLNKNEYETLMKHKYCIGVIKTQINHYYDTKNFDYNDFGITLRIREKNGKFTATRKTHSKTNYECSTEKSVQVANKFDTSHFENMDVHYKGSLTTYRITTSPFPGLKIMLDRNCYCGTTDYELEIEYEFGMAETANIVLRELCEYVGIESNNSRLIQGEYSINKSQRFFAKLKENEV